MPHPLSSFQQALHIPWFAYKHNMICIHYCKLQLMSINKHILNDKTLLRILFRFFKVHFLNPGNRLSWFPVSHLACHCYLLPNRGLYSEEMGVSQGSVLDQQRYEKHKPLGIAIWEIPFPTDVCTNLTTKTLILLFQTLYCGLRQVLVNVIIHGYKSSLFL